MIKLLATEKAIRLIEAENTLVFEADRRDSKKESSSGFFQPRY